MKGFFYSLQCNPKSPQLDESEFLLSIYFNKSSSRVCVCILEFSGCAQMNE